MVNFESARKKKKKGPLMSLNIVTSLITQSETHNQFSSVAQSCSTLCNHMNMPGLPVRHQLLESTQTHVH